MPFSTEISVVGVASSTLRSRASSISVGLYSSAALKNWSPGDEENHHLRSGLELAPVLLAAELIHVRDDLLSVADQRLAALGVVRRRDGFHVGRQRHLGVHHQGAAAGQPHHHVRPDAPVPALARFLFDEVAVLDHPGQLGHPAQGDLAPSAAGLRIAQRGARETVSCARLLQLVRRARRRLSWRAFSSSRTWPSSFSRVAASGWTTPSTAVCRWARSPVISARTVSRVPLAVSRNAPWLDRRAASARAWKVSPSFDAADSADISLASATARSASRRARLPRIRRASTSRQWLRPGSSAPRPGWTALACPCSRPR